MIIHKGLLESGRWFKFTLFEQLANVGCDVERIIYWKNKGDVDSSNKAFERALELMHFTIADPKNKTHRLKELCRVRVALIDYFAGDNEYRSTDALWQSYFYAFNYAAALQRGR